MSKSNPDSTNKVPDILNIVSGYQQGLNRMHDRAKSGTNKSEYKGKVAKEVAKLHPKRLKLKVKKIIRETQSTKTLRMISDEQTLPPFQAGQYINLFTEIDGVETARPYAISSCPTKRNHYDLTVKIVDNGFVTSHLLGDKVNVGQAYEATSPMGSFYHNPLFHGNDLVFLAGGSGGAPARSMISNVLNKGLDINYHLIYCNSFENDVIFADEFRMLAENHDNFTLTEIISQPSRKYKGLTGYIDQKQLSQLIHHVNNKTFYVCGPTPFNNHCQSELKKMGVENKKIRIECNGPPKKPSLMPKWPSSAKESDDITISIKGRGKFKAKVGEPLLNSLERNGYSVENACRSGECSLCRVKVLQGEVFNPPESRLRKSDHQFGWVHSCVAFPTTDIEILF
ncbi:MAG: FAD-binding oxidoreductase [Marinicellaceae bacterium]